MSKNIKENQLRGFKVVSKPEGEPTFTDESTGLERPYMIQTEIFAESENLASKAVEAQNWDLYLASGDLLYEVVSIEEL